MAKFWLGLLALTVGSVPAFGATEVEFPSKPINSDAWQIIKTVPVEVAMDDTESYGCVATAHVNVSNTAGSTASKYIFVVTRNDANPAVDSPAARTVEAVNNPSINDPNSIPVATTRAFTNLTRSNGEATTPNRHVFYLLGKKSRAADANTTASWYQLSVACVPVEKLVSLVTAKTGSGTGAIAGPGIACGADCSEPIPLGATVTVTATAGANSMFQSWTGCSSVSGTSCTVQLTASRTVWAAFTSTVSSLTVSKSGTGLGTVSGAGISCGTDCAETYPLGSTVTLTASANAGSTFAGWAGCSSVSGTTCTVAMTAARAVTATFTAAYSTLRIVNATKYAMIDVQVNGIQQVSYPNGLLPGGTSDINVSGAGTVSYTLGVGFYNTDHTRDVWFTLTGTATLVAGGTTSVTFNNPSIGQLLSTFRAAGRDWQGDYFDAGGGFHFAKYHFGISGSWTLYDSGTQIGTGTVTEVSWPNYATVVTFKLCASCASIDMAYPFGDFYYNNGPASWPIIHYVAQ